MTHLTKEQHALAIAEYEDAFGEVPHYLCLASCDEAVHNAIGLLPLSRAQVEALFGLPNLTQRLYFNYGPAFVILENTRPSKG